MWCEKKQSSDFNDQKQNWIKIIFLSYSFIYFFRGDFWDGAGIRELINEEIAKQVDIENAEYDFDFKTQIKNKNKIKQKSNSIVNKINKYKKRRKSLTKDERRIAYLKLTQKKRFLQNEETDEENPVNEEEEDPTLVAGDEI